MNCNRKNEPEHSKIEIRTIEFSKDIQPELTERRTSKASSIQEWLNDISKNDKPKMSIAYYHFGFMDVGDRYTVILVGLNDSLTHIDYEPQKKYFNLPKVQYKNMTEKQVLDGVKAQLKAFTETEEFKTSFFSQAQSIGINTESNVKEKIWSK